MRIVLALLGFVSLCGCSTVYSPEPVGQTPVSVVGAEGDWEGEWVDSEGNPVIISILDAANGEFEVTVLEKPRRENEQHDTADGEADLALPTEPLVEDDLGVADGALDVALLAEPLVEDGPAVADGGLEDVPQMAEPPEKKEPEVYPVSLRQVGDWMIASIKVDDAEGAEREVHPDDPKDWYMWGRVERKGRMILFWPADYAKFRALVEQGVLPGRATEKPDKVFLGPLNVEQLKLVTSEERGVLFTWDEPLVLFRPAE